MAKVELKKPVVEEIANSIKGAAAVVLVMKKYKIDLNLFVFDKEVFLILSSAA